MKFTIVSALLLWLALCLQAGLGSRLAIGPAVPDPVLVVVCSLSCFAPRRTGAVLGFLGGWAQGALAGANLAAYAISRTCAGFGVGWATGESETTLGMAVASVALGGMAGQLLLLFGAPPPSIPSFLLATITGAVYNGVIAIPVYIFVKRILDPLPR